MNATIIVTDGKVLRPFEGDLVEVQVQICLPCEKDSRSLHPELQFGNLARLAGESLWSGWGYYVEEKHCRANSFGVKADSFEEAVKAGIEKAKKYLAPLKEALAERRAKIRKLKKFQPKEISVRLY